MYRAIFATCLFNSYSNREAISDQSQRTNELHWINPCSWEFLTVTARYFHIDSDLMAEIIEDL